MKKIIIATLFMALVLSGCSLKAKTAQKVITPEEASAKTEKFITDNLVKEGTKVTIKSVAEENQLYKIVVDIGSGQDIDSYLSKDGEIFFPQAMNITEIEKEMAAQNAQVAGEKTQSDAATPAKSDKPTVELFVMSYCPYGTQIEKGIIPAIQALGDKVDFKLKFCDYTMHGAKETDENLKEYCVQKEQPEKLLSYMTCFLKEGKSEDCSKEAGLDSGKINSCISSATKEFSIDNTTTDFSIYKADAQKYGVQGSPTLIINGAQVDSGRDSASLLKTICSAFNTSPEECSKQLSTETPASGFGTATGGTSGGSCN
jgi:protein-disulfide isomerase